MSKVEDQKSPLQELKKEVDVLIEKAVKAHDSNDALRFSQAACNVSHALGVALGLK